MRFGFSRLRVNLSMLSFGALGSLSKTPAFLDKNLLKGQAKSNLQAGYTQNFALLSLNATL